MPKAPFAPVVIVILWLIPALIPAAQAAPVVMPVLNLDIPAYQATRIPDGGGPLGILAQTPDMIPSEGAGQFAPPHVDWTVMRPLSAAFSGRQLEVTVTARVPFRPWPAVVASDADREAP